MALLAPPSRAGKVTIFDRSWYGRVLVERVEGLRPSRMARAYSEINEFEEQLVDRGIVVIKFWIHITEDEQLRRFKEREKAEYKRGSSPTRTGGTGRSGPITSRRSTRWWSARARGAPWTIVEGNDKNFARLKVLKTAVASLKAAGSASSALIDKVPGYS